MHGLRQRLLADVGQGHFGPGFQERTGNSQADARTGTGDDGHLLRKIFHAE